ncbi:molybdenum cofactor biosynthesis protein F [Amycolatopsis echigonensis]|uniref:Molybdenum cofactor biosynthesis protein F n=1 Tax=Amycolatopsis echigonensis TaxID=2576905 RepID=A0A2N3WMN6_9PSEU|nr:MoaF C-terminal domain-containing protein [Amycolatopsis niigatensis]PKV95140.1 molybdenum cofactor biosynthesis protein F [Amycolatopsis niigatensis]
MPATNLSDTSTWLPLDGLAPGFDANKATTVDDLDDQSFTVDCADGGTFSISFAHGRASWDEDGTTGETAAETFLVDAGLFYVQFHPGAETAFSLLLDVRQGRALVITSTIGDGLPRVTQRFRPAAIQGREAHGEEIAPSTALIGRRVQWVYSEEHAYEHVYLTPHWYTWQCLSGPERGLADTDENSVYQIRPGIYVFAWREKVIPCASVTVADHRNVRELRSHGSLFGLGEDGTTPTHFTFGAYGRLLSNTVYSPDYDPAGQ